MQEDRDEIEFKRSGKEWKGVERGHRQNNIFVLRDMEMEGCYKNKQQKRKKKL